MNPLKIYNSLLKKFGKQNWWPVSAKNKRDRQFEICVGAILTQNTSWRQVEKAIKNLKNADALNENSIRNLDAKKIGLLIKPSGFYNQKALKLKNFAYFLEKYNLKKLENMPLNEVRNLLLNVKGIGNETCNSIMLYALNKPCFVIDAYTKRIFSHMIKKELKSYEEWQKFFENNLPKDIEIYKEYHALIVELGKRASKDKSIISQLF